MASNSDMHGSPCARLAAAATRRKASAAFAITFALAVAASLAAPAARADPPAKLKACGVAVLENAYLKVHCPNGRLGELLAALRDRTGVNVDLAPDLVASPVSVVLDRATLTEALDNMLANYNYTVDGPMQLESGRAAATSLSILSIRQASTDAPRDPAPNRGVTSSNLDAEPMDRSAAPDMTPAYPPTDGGGDPPPVAQTPGSASAPALPPGLIDVPPEQEEKAREAFYANLPKAGATPPPMTQTAPLPAAPSVTNSSGPNVGRAAVPLPAFTPGPESTTPPVFRR